jgi:TonB family protein
MIHQVRRVAVALLLSASIANHPAAAQDALTVARDLYATARYEEALRVLDAVETTAPKATRQSADLYRTLCLLAVGRVDEADQTIEAIIARDPLFQPGDELPPRTRIAFSDARKRLLPVIVQQQYADAKAAFDRQEYETAAATFKRVLDALNEPEIQPLTAEPPLSDLRTLAAGFHDLSVKATAPPPPPPPPPVVEAPRPVNLPPPIYGGEEPGVRAPVTLAQEMPRYPGAVPPTGIKGIVEVIIDEQGGVESMSMIEPVNAAYDKLLLNAASRWKFAPATLKGVPVKFRKRIQINVAPPSR